MCKSIARLVLFYLAFSALNQLNAHPQKSVDVPIETRRAILLEISENSGIGDSTTSLEIAPLETALVNAGFVVNSVKRRTSAQGIRELMTFRDQLNASPGSIGFVFIRERVPTSVPTGRNRVGDSQLDHEQGLSEGNISRFVNARSDIFSGANAGILLLVFDVLGPLEEGQFEKAVTPTKGLGRLDLATDRLIAVSALDNQPVSNGLFARVLAAEIARPGRPVEQAFIATQQRVARETNRQQTPVTIPSLYETFCFRTCNYGEPDSSASFDSAAFDHSSVIAGAEQACRVGEKQACWDAGYVYLYGSDQVRRDENKAIELLSLGCAPSFPAACNLYARQLWTLPDRSRYMSDIRNAYNTSCAANDPAGCLGLGAVIELNADSVTELMEANDYYRKSCLGGQERGCAYLAYNTFAGIGRARDPINGLIALKKSCRLRDHWACDQIELVRVR